MENKNERVLSCYEATIQGKLDCLKYAHENGCELGAWICNFAATHGHLDCLKYIIENGYNDWCWVSIVCARGDLDFLRCAHECDKNGYDVGYIGSVETLHIRGGGIAAAENGHLDCLKYLHEHGMKLTKDMCWEAAKNHHQDCVKYYHENA
jgi:hypothetical protein